MKFDYQSLLIKYIQHVTECESVDFITCGGMNYRQDEMFTPEEWAELERLAAVAEKSFDTVNDSP